MRQFETWEPFRNLGLVFVVCMGEEAVSGASAYARYQGGIEIETDTAPERRCQGLVRGWWYPNWDAHTFAAPALAEQPGCRLDHPVPPFS